MSALDQLQSAADANLEAANASLDAARQAQTETARLAAEGAAHGGVDPLVLGLTVFVLAIFVGYYVVWRVTPALHTPLMAVTNAISGIIVVGAMLQLASGVLVVQILAAIAVLLASINIFGGFAVTRRMLAMFSKGEAR